MIVDCHSTIKARRSFSQEKTEPGGSTVFLVQLLLLNFFNCEHEYRPTLLGEGHIIDHYVTRTEMSGNQQTLISPSNLETRGVQTHCRKRE